MNGKSDKHLIVSDEIHELIIKKQGEFFIEGIKISMQEIADMAILKGIDHVRTNNNKKMNNLIEKEIPKEGV